MRPNYEAKWPLEGGKMRCVYCGKHAIEDPFFCSEECINHAEAEAALRNAGSPPPARLAMPPPAMPARHDDGFVLPTDSEARKEMPIFSGVLNYFPLAIAAVARLSKRGNDKHNPGQLLHWSRGKSMDHEDCIARHLLDVETVAPSGEYEDATALAWRALAKLQELEERRLGKPMSRGSRVDANNRSENRK